jgi:hypothetical protein
MSILQSGIAREFCVGQARAAEIELIGANVIGCEKIVRAGCADDVVLIDAVAADSDRSNSARRQSAATTTKIGNLFAGEAPPDLIIQGAMKLRALLV